MGIPKACIEFGQPTAVFELPALQKGMDASAARSDGEKEGMERT